jgi:trigger factor
MKITNQSISDLEASFNLDFDQTELIEAKNEILKNYQKTFKYSGFRTGKVPLGIIDKNCDSNQLQSDLINRLINLNYTQAITELKLRVVSEPKIEVIKFAAYSELSIKVSVEIIGEIKLKPYIKLNVKVDLENVSSDQVEATIDQILERASIGQLTDLAAKNGNQLNIDFEGYDTNQNLIKEASGTNFDIVIGSKTFIPGFEENLIGLKSQDEKTFILTFPANYHQVSFQNKKVTFKVKVNSVSVLKKAKLDLDFIKKYGPFKSIPEFKAEIKKQLEFETKKKYDQDLDRSILEKLSDLIEVKVPNSLVDKELDVLKNEDKQVALYQGQTFSEYLKAQNLNEESYDKNLKLKALNRIKSGLALSEIAIKEKIQVTKEELSKQLQILKSKYNDPESQQYLSSLEAEREIGLELLSQKTLKRIKELL